MIRIAGYVNDSITDGSGLRFALFTQGCPHGCEGCHNPQTHDFNGGKEVSAEEVIALIDANPIITGVTFSGGEPMCQAKELIPVAEHVKRKGLHLAVYTGYTFEELMAMKNENVMRLIGLCDIIVDGRFVKELKSYDLKFKGSSNQRVLDAAASLAQKAPVLTGDKRWI